MFAKPAKLSHKIVGTLIVFLLIATVACGLTLVISWQLEGVAAAINDAGSQRMRTYRMTHLMVRGVKEPSSALTTALGAEGERINKVLSDLQGGDAAKPLSSPRNAEVDQRLLEVEQEWMRTLRPLVEQYLAGNPDQRAAALDRLESELEPFVSRINELVLAMERS